ncbi:unnamed protein product [Kuraishia capsulata CBS 1993]|uniref:Uncharacterized protein n=1 Tax=Kuraishia capsulata CBS 1993 TaxID=1382522 RepID=W6MPR2_9ASCO|nr:uncharacterized protein KUCA_T00004305001 [Kuraishia capsulata CBS 1993]CDK28323.1 unnamed protein product [Kuraishia capsulata CBS 1993]
MERLTSKRQMGRSVLSLRLLGQGSGASTAEPKPETVASPPDETGASPSASQDRIIALKSLNRYLSKYTSKRGIERSNVLRIHFIPVLLQLQSFPVNSRYWGMVCSTLTRWWVEILTALKTDLKMPSSDRSVHLECLSKIISRREWSLAQDFAKVYRDLLTQTLEYAIKRLDSKKISLSASAFVGKVFAYAFFNLPGAAGAMLFLLGVKIDALDTVKDTLLQQAQAQSPLDLLNSQNRPPKVEDEQIDLDRLQTLFKAAFPEHVSGLIGSKSRFESSKNLLRVEKKFLNAVPPPSDPVKGINDPKGLWVQRWSCLDNNDVFFSFLRHYLNLCGWYLRSTATHSLRNAALCCPGFTIILAHLHSYTEIQVQRRGSAPAKRDGFTDLKIPVPFLKFLRALRDLCFNSVDDYESAIVPMVCKSVDLILGRIASKISVFDTEKCCMVLDLQFEFTTFVYQTNDSFYTQFIDWRFWLKVLDRMTSCDNLTLELKGLSYLFNSWDMIADQQEFVNWTMSNWFKYFCHWQPLVRTYYHRLVCWRLMTNGNNTQNIVSNRLKSSRKKLVNHILQFDGTGLSSPHVKLPSFEPSSPIINRKMVISPIAGNWEQFQQQLLVGSFDENKPYTSDLVSFSRSFTTTHPYEIFDESTYTTGTSTPQRTPSSTTLTSMSSSTQSNVSLYSSVFKFFKKGMNHDASDLGDAVKAKGKSNAKSKDEKEDTHFAKAFSSLSLSSRSSSPSVMSTRTANSPPSSYSSFEELFIDEEYPAVESALGEDYIVSPDFKFGERTPDVYRQQYKFELVIDDLSMGRQIDLVNRLNGNLRLSGVAPTSIPLDQVPAPRLPKSPFSESQDAFFELGFTPFKPKMKHALDLNRMNNLGRSFAEWNLCVEQFEMFMNSHYDFPLLDVESPNKLNGY